VSNEASVDEGLAQIEATLPQIAGVAFGPLVLQDVMFKNMDLSMLEMVLAPKVDGARLLNERLSDPNKPLDFFVMFSSFVMVSGNPGQAAYSAANAYTHALAQQRRSRGMAGSTMDIGAVFGVGFIARAGREHEYDVVKFMFDEVNEWELHSLFAEAVVAGRDRSSDDVEVITGMPLMDPSNRDRIPYYDDPRFSGFKVSDQRNRTDDQGKGAGSVKEQLLQAKDMQQVNDILLEGLSGRVRVALQLTAADELALAVPLIDQGVDSLSAVTISSWFTKSLGVEVPLLRILGGASINDLIEEVVPRLAAEAIPLVASDGLAPTVSVESAAQQSSATSSSNDASDSAPNSQNYDTQPTTSDDESEEDTTREVPLSLIQEYSWKQQQLPLSSETFNSTIGMYMKGPINLDRLGWAFDRVLQRHDAFRTSFHSKDGNTGSPLATVLPSTRAKFEAIAVANREAADQGFRDLEKFKFDLEGGLTIKIVCFHWSPTDCLLIIAYHRLVGDGWTTEHLFVEASQLYSGARLERAPKYSNYALRQREALSTGAFEEDLNFWKQAFETLPPRLHVLQVPGAKAIAASSPPQWDEYELSCRLNRMVAVRVRDRSRKHKVSPMHYYLAAFHVLLARLAEANDSADITIGLADTNRQTLVDQSTMGFFANLLPIRLGYAPDQIFNEILSEVKEQVRAALVHSSVPYMAILDRLSLPSPDQNDSASHAPLFQAVFDYKQGQTESGTIGDASIVDSRTPRAGSPYDITLEMSDDPSKEPLVTIKLQKGLYEEKDAEVLMDAYLSIVSIFSRNPALRVADGRLDQRAKARA
jgi:hybrid polyketide synthase/nonribosomal peptide synthetase ACE1